MKNEHTYGRGAMDRMAQYMYKYITPINRVQSQVFVRSKLD